MEVGQEGLQLPEPGVFPLVIFTVAWVAAFVIGAAIISPINLFGVRCPCCQEQRSDNGYEETGHRGLGFIFSSIRSAHFTLAAKGNFAHRGVSIAFA